MKAIWYTAFGNSGVLQLSHIAKPVCKEDEILIKISATSVNPFDIKVRNGTLQNQLNIQLPYVPGSDIAGIVEAVGANVTQLAIGDEVFATVFGGSYTEYICLKETQAIIKPKNVNLNEAVALAVPLVTAYTVLVEDGKLIPNQKVLIHGAAGGVGSIMVQMAKALGAYVIGTASGSGITLLNTLGADEVIDYKAQDFTQLVSNVDMVVDLVGGETLSKSFKIIKKGGKLLSTVMPPTKELAEKFEITAKFVFSNPSAKKLAFGKELVEQGKIKAQIAGTMKLEQAAIAQDLLSTGGLNGKLILEIN